MYQPKISTEITLKRLQQKIKENRRSVYSGLSIIFFLANYHICQYFYPLNDAESVRLWWLLKVDIYVLVICLCYLAINADTTKLKKIQMFMNSFGVGLAISNFIDRRFLDDRYFSWDSMYAVVVIAIVSYFNVMRLIKQSEKHAKHLTK